MGFKQNQRGNGKYITLKEGKLKFNGEVTDQDFEAALVEIEIKPDKYNEKEYQKVILYLWDEPDSRMYEMSFALTSGYGFSFFAQLPNVDPDALVTFSAGQNKLDNGNNSGVLFLSQQGKSLKWWYSKKNNPKEWEKIPEPIVMKAATKTKPAILDYEKRDEFIEKILTSFQSKKLSKLYPKGAAGFKAKEKPIDNNSLSKGNDAPEIDDLPF